MAENAFKRDRLHEQIKKALEENKKLILVHANVGWGKTTLLSHLVHDNQSIPADAYKIEYHVTGDISQVVSDLITIICHLIPETKKWIFEKEVNTKREEDNTLFRCNRLVYDALATHPQKFVFLLTDFHKIGEKTPLLDNCLEILFDSNVPNLSFIISTESSEIFPARILLLNQVTTIKKEDLAFNKSEIHGYFKGRVPVQLTDEDVNDIYDKTDGWPMSLRLIRDFLSRKRKEERLKVFLDSLKRDQTLHRMLKKLFDIQPDEVKDFLIKTSVVDSFSPSLCEAGLGIDNAEDIIGYLLEGDFFIYVSYLEEKTCRYNTLFRGFLSSQLKKKEPAYLNNLQERVSSYYLTNQHWQDALKYCVETKQFQNAANAMKGAVINYIEDGTVSSDFLRWIDPIVQEVNIEDDHVLLFVKGWALFKKGELDKAEPYLEKAKTNALNLFDAKIFGQAMYLLMFGNFIYDNFEKNKILAEGVLQILPDEAPEKITIQAMLAISLGNLGDMTNAKKIWGYIESHPGFQKDETMRAIILPLKAFNYHFFLGQFQETNAIVKNSITYLQAGKSSIGLYNRLTRSIMFSGLFLYDQGFFIESKDTLETAIKETINSGERFSLPGTRSIFALNALNLGQTKLAQDTMAELNEFIKEAPTAIVWKQVAVYTAKAAVAYHSKQMDGFYSNANKAIQLVEEKDNWFDRYLVYLNLVPYFNDYGDHAKSIDLLRIVLKGSEAIGAEYGKARSLLLLSEAYYEKDNKKNAWGYLNKSLAISQKNEFYFLFLNKEASLAAKLLPEFIKQSESKRTLKEEEKQAVKYAIELMQKLPSSR